MDHLFYPVISSLLSQLASFAYYAIDYFISLAIPLHIINCYITLCEFFTTTLSDGLSLGVWVTASLLKSPRLFTVFWPMFAMLLFEWSRLVLRFITLPVFLRSLWGLFQVHQLQLVSPYYYYYYYYYYLTHLRVLHTSVSWCFFHWSLSDSKSHQVSRTLLSVLADLDSAIVWMVPTRPLICKSSSPCATYYYYDKIFYIWDLTNLWKSKKVHSSSARTQVRKFSGQCGNLLSFLLRCGTRPYERGTQWDSNSQFSGQCGQ